MLQKKPTCGRARSLHVAKTDTHGMPGIPNGGTNAVGIGTAASMMKGSTNAMLPLALALLAACMAPCADAGAAFNVTRLIASQAKVTNITYGNSGESYAGSLPTEIGMLTDVKVVNLNEIALTGTLPTQLGSITKLSYGNGGCLGANALTGTIPTQLGRWSDYEHYFTVTANQLTGTMPTELGQLSKLTYGFGASSNQFSSALPTELGNLVQMTDGLWQIESGFTSTVPSEIGRLVNMNSNFWLYSNQFTGALPSELGNIVSMVTSFSVNNNAFSKAIPTQVGRLISIESGVRLDQNSFSQAIPTQLGNMVDITSVLYLKDNSFTSSMPTEFGRFSKLESGISWTLNSITGNLPSQLGMLTCVTESFNVHTSYVKGENSSTLPTEIGQLTGIASRLQIYGRHLTGPIPSELGRLTALGTYFSLYGNSFSGTLPSELGNLATMSSYFNLYGNTINGPLPSELGQLSNMYKYLYLYSNNLSGTLPTEIGNLVSMVSQLNLGYNSLSGVIPTELGDVVTLKAGLKLENNKLSGSIPTELGKFTKLAKYLKLQSNSLSSALPSELGNLASLNTFFGVNSNQLCSDVPTELAALSSSMTDWLVTTENSLGTVCGWIEDSRFPAAGSTTATALDYHGDNIYGTLPTQFGLLTDITSFSIWDNYLSGPIPTELGNLVESEEDFWMSRNSFTGQLPTQLGKLVAMSSSISVRDNDLSGTLPSQLGRLQLAAGLYLYGNKFTAVPTELGYMSEMQSEFSLYSNLLSSTVPTQLGNLVKMTSALRLSWNPMSGSVPSELGQLTDFRFTFRLDETSASGSMPTQLGQLVQMSSYFLFSKNSLSAAIPTQLGQLSQMSSYFYLYSNSFSGAVPTQLGQLGQLSYGFCVYDNKIGGTIPTELAQMTGIQQYFDLMQNSLTGPIPTEFGNLAALNSYFRLQHNSLDSTVPTELGNIPLYIDQTLNNNRLTGTVPTEIGQSGMIKQGVYFNSNSLTGTLPTQLGNVNLYNNMKFHSNKLSGAIPTQLGNLVRLATGFNLTMNKLCSDVPTEVEALSSGLATGEFLINEGNDLGTDCCDSLPDVYTCSPSPAPTVMPTYWCDDGAYMASDGTCTTCAIGRYRFNNDTIYSKWTRNNEWMSNCTLCPAGTYNVKTGQSACISCASGKTSSDDRASCTDCWPGTFVANDTICVDCPRGKYSPVALNDRCLDCSKGFETQKEIGATVCISCNSGYYSKAQSVNCSSCPAGSYSKSQAAECQECEAEHYAREPAQSACMKCSSELGNAYTSEAGAAGCVCKVGYFLYGSECVSCPEGTECAQGTTLESMVVQKGFYRFDSTSPMTYACPYPANCLGGVGVAGDNDRGGGGAKRRRLVGGGAKSQNTTTSPQPTALPTLQPSPLPTPQPSSVPTSSCIEGAGGPLCYTCDDSYFHSSWSDVCVACSEVAGEGWLGPLVIVIFIALSIFLVNHFRRQIRAWAIKNKRWLLTAWAKLVAFIVCMQIILVVAENHVRLGGVEMSEPYKSFLDMIPVLNFEFTALFLPLSCMTDSSLDHLDTLAATTLLPMVVFGILCGYLDLKARSMQRSKSKGRQNRKTRERERKNASRLRRQHNLVKYFMMQTMILAYPMICRKICQSFTCDSFDIGGEYNFTVAATTTTSVDTTPVSALASTEELRLLRYDPAIDCTSDRYYFLVSFGLVCFLVYPFGVPLFLFFSLFRWRHQLNPPTYEDEYRAVRARRKNKAMMKDSAVLFALEYRPAYWWFEVWSLVRRFFLTALLLVFETLESCTLYVLFAVLGMLVLEREWSANLDAYLVNIQYTLNLQILFAVLYMLLLDAGMLDGELAAEDTTGLTTLPVFISACLLVFNITLVAAMGVAARLTIAKDAKTQDRLDKLHDQVVIDKQEDKDRFTQAWKKLVLTGGPNDERRLLRTLEQLAKQTAISGTGKQPTPQQDTKIASVDHLLEQADTVSATFHEQLKAIVKQCGGEYQPGPNKSRVRAVEKMENDYDGDHTKLVDIVRASGIFPNFLCLAMAVDILMSPDCALIVVRAKDRFNKPTDFGYKDMLLNVRLEGSDHVGELQLHLAPIIEVKPACHRTYALMRAVGWEDDNKEDDGDVDEEEVESEEEEEENEYGVDASGDALANTRRSDSLQASEWHKREILVEPTTTGDASPTMDAGRLRFSEKKSSFTFYEVNDPLGELEMQQTGILDDNAAGNEGPGGRSDDVMMMMVCSADAEDEAVVMTVETEL